MEKKAIDIAAWVGFVGFCALGVAAAYAYTTLPGADAADGGAISGKASWYSRAECVSKANPNALMANGKPLNDAALTCAMWDVPFGTRVLVRSGDRSVVCVVTDRGPAKRLVRSGRVIDLSKATFQRLGDLRAGLVPVTVEVQR
jgi:rare lipoprotein A